MSDLKALLLATSVTIGLALTDYLIAYYVMHIHDCILE